MACPYSHPSRAVRLARFDAANAAASALMLDGHKVFSPISHTHPIAEAGGLPLGWDFWEEFDRAFLGISRKIVVLRVDGWDKSTGVAAEIGIATEYGIPVEYIDPATPAQPEAALTEGLGEGTGTLWRIGLATSDERETIFVPAPAPTETPAPQSEGAGKGYSGKAYCGYCGSELTGGAKRLAPTETPAGPRAKCLEPIFGPFGGSMCGKPLPCPTHGGFSSSDKPFATPAALAGPVQPTCEVCTACGKPFKNRQCLACIEGAIDIALLKACEIAEQAERYGACASCAIRREFKMPAHGAAAQPTERCELARLRAENAALAMRAEEWKRKATDGLEQLNDKIAENAALAEQLKLEKYGLVARTMQLEDVEAKLAEKEGDAATLREKLAEGVLVPRLDLERLLDAVSKALAHEQRLCASDLIGTGHSHKILQLMRAAMKPFDESTKATP